MAVYSYSCCTGRRVDLALLFAGITCRGHKMKISMRSFPGKRQQRFIVGVLVVITLRIPWLPVLGVNMESLNAAAALVHTASGLHLESIAHAECYTYPEVVRLYRTVQALPEQRLAWLEHQMPCLPPERQQFFAMWRANDLAEVGSHAEACDLLVRAQNGAELSRLAQAMYDRGEFEQLERYLGCITELAAGGVWTSPYNVAVLFHRLGHYQEEQGRVTKAMLAYEQAAEWYPVVWAAPYISIANLLEQEGRTDEAMLLLQDAIRRSTDATASFNLWLVLGRKSEAVGDYQLAYCSYMEAQQLSNDLPLHLASMHTRKDITERLDLLQGVHQLKSSLCQAAF
jgi:tetratricopeptide (TPR) repeat protein